jgi:TetR/AcrR family transcriptional regulator, transcriptional repressor for nem operon
MMGRTSDAKERLLRTGGELIHQRGYSAVSINDACAEAGVKKGSFYHFFPSKVEFMASVIDDYSNRTASSYGELAHGEDPPIERLSTYLDGIRTYHEDLQRLYGAVVGCPIGNLALEMSTLEAELRDSVRVELAENRVAFETCVQQAIGRGDIHPMDTNAAARAIQAQIQGMVMQAKVEDDPGVLDDLRPTVLRLLGVGE